MNDRTISNAAIYWEACEIADRIRDVAVEFSQEDVGWVGYGSSSGTPSVAVRKGLYRGQLGVAIYLAAVDQTIEAESYRGLAADAVDVLFEQDAEEVVADLDAGVGNGVGSLVYGLSVLAELTGDRRYRDRANQFVRAFTDEQIRADDDHDVLYGSAGALLGLLALYERSDEVDVLNTAVACGEHLLDSRYDKWGYQVWNTLRRDEGQSVSTGMGHGVAGICYALYRLYGHTGRTEFRDAADDALGFENVFYSADQYNWKANWLAVPAYPQWWCYGVAGIGLARLGSLQYHDSDVLRRDLDRAWRFGPELASNDQLCHGTFSQVAFLTELGRKHDETATAQARTLAAAAVERKQEAGGYRVPCGGIYNPALFLGTAGIGYALLRLLAPDELPSLLRFE